MDTLDRVSCGDGYTPQATIKYVYNSNGGYATIETAAVYMQLAYGPQGFETWTDEVRVVPGNVVISPKTIGVRFRNYVAGTVAVVSGAISTQSEPSLALSAAGQVTPTAAPTSIFNVLDPTYAADPTGVTDSAARIQAAINDCASSGGGIVYCPRGTYLLGTNLNFDLADKVLFMGAGTGGWQVAGPPAAATLFKFTGTGRPVMEAQTSSGISGLFMRDFGIWCVNDLGAGVAALLWDGVNIEAGIKNVAIGGSWTGVNPGDGVHILNPFNGAMVFDNLLVFGFNAASSEGIRVAAENTAYWPNSVESGNMVFNAPNVIGCTWAYHIGGYQGSLSGVTINSPGAVAYNHNSATAQTGMLLGAGNGSTGSVEQCIIKGLHSEDYTVGLQMTNAIACKIDSPMVNKSPGAAGGCIQMSNCQACTVDSGWLGDNAYGFTLDGTCVGNSCSGYSQPGRPLTTGMFQNSGTSNLLWDMGVNFSNPIDQRVVQFSNRIRIGGGSQVLSGAGVPGVGVGGNGDLYIRDDGAGGSALYYKVGGAWAAIA